MARPKTTKADVLISIGELEKLAGKYEQTGKTLRMMARNLRSVTEALGGAEASPKPSGRKKTAKRPKASPSGRKPMSKAAKKAISDRMKAKWRERKEAAASEKA